MKYIPTQYEKTDFDSMEELDVEKFIRFTTYEIWDMKQVDKIYDYYDENTVIHGTGGMKVSGAESIVKDTRNWLKAFPDITVRILDVVWMGNPRDGYKASMPWYFHGTNTGMSEYGPATGKKLDESNNLGIANTMIKKIDGKWKYVEDEISTYDVSAKKMVCTE